MIIKKIKNLILFLSSSHNGDEEKQRREMILNIILMVSIAGFIIINIVRIADYFIYPEIQGLPLWTTFGILIFFCILLWLSKKGRSRISAWLLIATYSLPMFYCFMLWGADLPAALLLAVLIITMSGILIGGYLILTTSAVISLTLIIITLGQQSGKIAVQNYWRDQPTAIGDIITYSTLLLIAAFIAWLFNRGIIQALRRAKLSEEALKKERDNLEITVAERTAELRQAEAEKINQLYRLAEFGRLSSGIFHDLINPLTAVSLNLEQVKEGGASQVGDAKLYLGQALVATKKMEGLIASIKKQLQKENKSIDFSITEEIDQIVQILSYKARRANVTICRDENNNFIIKGDPVKFSQAIMNILANAIESCEEIDGDKKIKITSSIINGEIIISISDEGSGISPENLKKIFMPFFSTKNNNQGLGLGLASTKSIIEKDFGGRISVESRLGQGAKFSLCLPTLTNKL
jgi:signal transduction histidine kinase